MKLCLFQGTFNPIHNAHIQVAEFALKHIDCEKILFIPAYKPPHKDFDSKTCLHRLNMVKLAVESNENFEVSDIEFELNGKSYTYLTILELYKRFKIDGKIKFLIGTDAYEKIETWFETDKLKNLVDFVVFIRENNFDKTRFENLRKKGYNFEFMPLEFLDISSTLIRDKIKNCENINGLVPQKVEEYIKNNDLYKN